MQSKSGFHLNLNNNDINRKQRQQVDIQATLKSRKYHDIPQVSLKVAVKLTSHYNKLSLLLSLFSSQ